MGGGSRFRTSGVLLSKGGVPRLLHLKHYNNVILLLHYTFSMSIQSCHIMINTVFSCLLFDESYRNIHSSSSKAIF